MAVSLSHYVAGRDNNYNLIRFIAAFLVLFSHSYVLVGERPPLSTLVPLTLSSVAVDIFFVSSGFLVMGSLLNRPNLWAFAWARILRIYPALIVAVLFSVVVVGWYFTTLNTADYFSDATTLKYIKRNITMLSSPKYELPGVFANNPFPNAVNGSLWTLPYEIKMYAYLAVICSILLFLQRRFLGLPLFKALFLLMTVLAVLANSLSVFGYLEKDYKLHFFAIFFAGAAFYLFKEKIVLSLPFALFLTVALLVATAADHRVFKCFYLLVLPYLVLALAYLPGGFIRHFNRFGDYSYGLYIYAFPVQQSIAALIPGVGVAAMIALSFVVSLLLSIMSWHLIEKRALALKGSYAKVQALFRLPAFMQKKEA